LAVQEVVSRENLLANCRVQGGYLAKLLRDRLLSSSSMAAPFTFDVRGGGTFWCVEFDFSRPEAARAVDFKGERFARLVQARSLQNGLVIMGMIGDSYLEETVGDLCLLAPAYNVTKHEVEVLVDIFVQSVEEVLSESFVSRTKTDISE
jgi:E3 ubiquitin-protein ligase TRIP12